MPMAKGHEAASREATRGSAICESASRLTQGGGIDKPGRSKSVRLEFADLGSGEEKSHLPRARGDEEAGLRL